MQPIMAVAIAIAVLLIAILRFRVPAFLALLVVSLSVGLGVGMDYEAAIASVQSGMGGTLGFVAVVVGLGAMFGALLDHGGGIQSLSKSLLARFGPERAPYALGIVGFLVAIPVFFDVAFIILVPLIAGLAASSRRSVVYFAMPLAAGLVVTHAFVPPTPGPVAVTELLQADLGWVILFGAAAGLPAMLVAGPFFAPIAERLTKGAGSLPLTASALGIEAEPKIGLSQALVAVLLPLVLIISATLSKIFLAEGPLRDLLVFLGHPFTALIIACFYAAVLCLAKGLNAKALHDVMVRSLEPAGIVVLVTGAGGAFKQVLVDSGAGSALAGLVSDFNLAPIVFGFLVALFLRVAQGSATVAMITAAGLAAPVIAQAGLNTPQTALVVIAIASGASAASHVNDSGFWLVSRYLGLTEAETLKSWTVMTSLIGAVGFLSACVLSFFF